MSETTKKKRAIRIQALLYLLLLLWVGGVTVYIFLTREFGWGDVMITILLITGIGFALLYVFKQHQNEALKEPKDPAQ